MFFSFKGKGIFWICATLPGEITGIGFTVTANLGKTQSLNHILKSDSATKWQVCSSVKKSGVTVWHLKASIRALAVFSGHYQTKESTATQVQPCLGDSSCVCKHPMSEKMCSDG